MVKIDFVSVFLPAIPQILDQIAGHVVSFFRYKA